MSRNFGIGKGPSRLGTFVGDDIAHDRADIPLSGGNIGAGTQAVRAGGSNPPRSTIPAWLAVLATAAWAILFMALAVWLRMKHHA